MAIYAGIQVGRSASHIPQVAILPLFFLSTFYRLAFPDIDFTTLYIIILCCVLCATGIGFFLSLVVEPKNAQLAGVVFGFPVGLQMVAPPTITYMKNFMYNVRGTKNMEIFNQIIVGGLRQLMGNTGLVAIMTCGMNPTLLDLESSYFGYAMTKLTYGPSVMGALFVRGATTTFKAGPSAYKLSHLRLLNHVRIVFQKYAPENLTKVNTFF